MLGMYVHTHWNYNHPYAARTWSESDWCGYLAGLAHLGYDAVMFWPLLDAMPAAPNASDRRFLAKVARVIDMAHDDFGMRFLVVACPNTIGNAKADAYDYESRPYFVCEHKVDPKDPSDVRAFLDGRREQFAPLAKADALVVIDSDPGGYPGSTDEEFVSLCAGQLDVFRSFNPAAAFEYWMLIGWENYNRFWKQAHERPRGEQVRIEHELRIEEPTFLHTLELMKRRIAEPSGVLASMDPHLTATEKLDLVGKRWFYPYGVIEGEPTFPLTNYDPAHVAASLAGYSPERFPRGVMANAQNHVLQLPHTYLFAHHARRSGTPPDLTTFAADVLPDCADVVAESWQSIGSNDAARQRAAAERVRQRIGRSHGSGPCTCMLFGDADRFLSDLSANLEIRAALSDFNNSFAVGHDPRPPLRTFLHHFRPYQQRTGFVDVYAGPLDAALNQPLSRLNEPAITRTLARFNEWQDLSARHNVVPPLLDAIERYCAVG